MIMFLIKPSSTYVPLQLRESPLSPAYVMHPCKVTIWPGRIKERFESVEIDGITLYQAMAIDQDDEGFTIEYDAFVDHHRFDR
jgi:hypothetical protein